MLRMVVLGEARADAQLACDLVDRIFFEEGPQWVRDLQDTPDTIRTWQGLQHEQGLQPGQHYACWRDIKKIAKNMGLRSNLRRAPRHGNMGTDYASALKAIQVVDLLIQRGAPIDALVMIRDLDSQPERAGALDNARKQASASFAIAIATPDPKREAWVLVGFEPDTQEERHTLTAQTKALGFAPNKQAHRLRGVAKSGRADRDPKKILDALTQGNWAREERCWRETPLHVLHDRGKDSQLTAFLDDVRKHLKPLLG
ncbi:MAG: hypothetical protein AAFS10_27340 [Myxococcota bacterium]